MTQIDKYICSIQLVEYYSLNTPPHQKKIYNYTQLHGQINFIEKRNIEGNKAIDKGVQQYDSVYKKFKTRKN